MALELHPGETVDFKVTLYQASGAETDTFDTVTGIEWSVSDPEAVEIARRGRRAERRPAAGRAAVAAARAGPVPALRPGW